MAVLAAALLLLPWAPVLLLRWVDPVTSAFMLGHCYDGTLGGLLDCRILYSWVDWNDISPHLSAAVMASEDQKFPRHSGFDFDSIANAVEDGIREGRMRGASTITQQVAKNLFLWPGRSLLRKGLEAYLTVAIETTWPKRRILEVYLNVCEFGYGVYGVGAASWFFLGRSPAELTLEQSALLAAVLPDPLRMRADRPGPAVLERRDWIVEQVGRLGRDPLHGL